MRVALVCLNYPPEPTGIAVYTGGLAEGLARRGVDVSVISGLPHYPQWRLYDGYGQGSTSEDRDVGQITVERRRHAVPKHPHLVNRLWMEFTFGLNAVLSPWRKPDAVIVVSPALFASILVSLRALLIRRPLIVWVQDIYSLGVSETGRGGWSAERLMRVAESWLLRRARAVVTIHDRFKAYLIRDLGIDAEKITVIRNWAHIENSSTARQPTVRARYGWPDDATVVLHAGNMGAKQGLENVVEASQIATSEGRNLLFVLMGDGNQRTQLEAAGSNPRLRIMDPLPRAEFVDALLAADALLVNERPGLTEMAVPSKLTSYFATGRPVIAATDRGSVTAEEMELAGGGLRVDAGQPRQLVDAALTLRGNPQLAARLGARGRTFREATLTEDASLDAFYQLVLSMAHQD